MLCICSTIAYDILSTIRSSNPSQVASSEPAKDTPFYEEDKSEESEDSDDGLYLIILHWIV